MLLSATLGTVRLRIGLARKLAALCLMTGFIAARELTRLPAGRSPRT